MDKKEIYLTEKGLDEIKKELDFLKLEKRPEIILALKEARAQGDLSENSEYDAARNEQALVESKIAELEKMVENAVVIKEVDTDKVSIGTSVKIEGRMRSLYYIATVVSIYRKVIDEYCNDKKNDKYNIE